MTTRLAVGDLAPDFILPTADGGKVTLSELRGQHVVVYFYPAAMTPGCSLEACDFTTARPDFERKGFTIIGVSPDTVERLAEFAARDGLTHVLAADPERTVLEAWGAWGEKNLYGKTVTTVIRSTIVVGPDGRVVHAAYNVKATGHVARLRAALGID